jgi:hypothetical protein
MAAPTNAANVKKVLANSEPSTHGPSRHFAAAKQIGRFQAHNGHYRISRRLLLLGRV